MVVLASGAPLPAVRAGITLTILLLAPLVRRAPDPIHSLAVAALVLLLLNPLTLFDPGAQIAFATIAALLLYLPPLEALILPAIRIRRIPLAPVRRTLRALPTYLLAGCVAQLACTATRRLLLQPRLARRPARHHRPRPRSRSCSSSPA